MSRNAIPTAVRNSHDFDYFAERLHDKRLLKHAVVLPNGELAVPVGGKRKGGFACCGPREGRAFIKILSAWPERFPNLRFQRGGKDWSATIEWGAALPDLDTDDRAEGAFFGYSSKAINEFLRRLHSGA